MNSLGWLVTESNIPSYLMSDFHNTGNAQGNGGREAFCMFSFLLFAKFNESTMDNRGVREDENVVVHPMYFHLLRDVLTDHISAPQPRSGSHKNT